VADIDLVKRSVTSLERYIAAQDFAGYDPYDALQSPLFRLPILRSSKILRLGSQQILKRSPINIRPLLRIPKGRNPVTLGLCVQAYAYLAQVESGSAKYYADQVNHCIELLEGTISRGYSGACWGYDFHWEARYAKVPAFTPTIVATGIITNGLFEANRYIPIPKALTLCKSATGFVLNDLHKSTEDDSFCYSYSPLDRQKVLNATMKGARLLSQVYSITRDEQLRTEARKTVSFVLRNQREDGSWPYAIGDTRSWTDNFHTGYVLDCMEEF
jgi:hypothetical protein